MNTNRSKRIFRQILLFGFATVLFVPSCRSFELKPEAKNVQVFSASSSLFNSIEANKGRPNSPFSKCQAFPEVTSNGRNTWGDRMMSDEEKANAKNDVVNQAAGQKANLIFITESQFAGEISGVPYRCDSLETIVTLQKNIDAEEKKKQDAENEKKLQEWYASPQHWVICVSTNYSALPPSTIKAMLSGPNYRPTVYESASQCADKAWYRNRMGEGLGIKCACEYTKLDRNKVEAMYGK